MDTNTKKTVKPLVEVTIKMKVIGTKGDILARCEAAGIKTHIETRAEYEAKRDSQKKDAEAGGIDAERFGRVDRVQNVVFDPGMQIAHGTDVKLESFRRDLEMQGFKLVGLKLFQGFGKPAYEYLFTVTYAKDDRPEFELTLAQRTMVIWFFARTFGNVYVWRNLGGAQFDIPALGIRTDPRVMAIDMRLMRNGRELKVGEQHVQVEFEGDVSTVTA